MADRPVGSAVTCVAGYVSPDGHPRVAVDWVESIPAAGLKKAQSREWLTVYDAVSMRLVVEGALYTSDEAAKGCSRPTITSDGRYAVVGAHVVNLADVTSRKVTYTPVVTGPYIAETVGMCANCINGLTSFWVNEPATGGRHHVLGDTTQTTSQEMFPKRDPKMSVAVNAFAAPELTVWAKDGRTYLTSDSCEFYQFDIMTGTNKQVTSLPPSLCGAAGIREIQPIPESELVLVAFQDAKGNRASGVLNTRTWQLLWHHPNTWPITGTAKQTAVSANDQLVLLDTSSGEQLDFAKDLSYSGWMTNLPYIVSKNGIYLVVDQP